MEVVYKNNNVYADISGLVLGDFSEKFERFMKNEIEEMITYAGATRGICCMVQIGRYVI
jgi:hypothetical protein